MILRRKKSYSFTINNFIFMLLIVFTGVIAMPPISFGLTVFQTTNEAILFAEMCPNVAFQKFGFKKVTSVSRANTVSNITDTTNIFSADFTFVIDGVSYSGPGTWESIEISESLNITIDYRLSSDQNVLNFHYTSSGDFTSGVKDETVNASLGTSTLEILKRTEETIAPTLKTQNITGTVEFNNEKSNLSITIVENIISSDISNFSIISQNTPVDPQEPDITLQAEYGTATNDQFGETATFTTYDVTIGEELTYTLNTSDVSTHQLLIVDGSGGDSINEILDMNLLHVTNDNQEISYLIENSIQRNSLSKLLRKSGEGWSWGDFGKESFKGAVAGGAGGAAVAALSTDGGVPVSVPTAAALGAIGGGAAGAMGYMAEKLWEALFENEALPAEPEPVATYAENDDMSFGQSAESESSSYSIPTLSEWKKIFLTLMLVCLVMGFIHKIHSPSVLSTGSTLLKITNGNLMVFNGHVYCFVLKWVSFVVFLVIVGTKIIFGNVSLLDITGTFFCTPLVAYILQIVILLRNDYEIITEKS